MCCMKTVAGRLRGLRCRPVAWQVVQSRIPTAKDVRAVARRQWQSGRSISTMKKTFPLQVPGKDAARVLESVKSELRKYVQREQRKKLPEGFNRWEFACKVGVEEASAAVKPLSEVVTTVDAAAKAGAAGVFVEIVAVPGRKPDPESTIR